MRAVRLQQWNSEPDLVEIPTPAPGPGEVLLRVDAAGLCHSDLHMMEWPEEVVPYTLPFTLGHETAGTVAALGPGVRGVSEGDRVLRLLAVGLRVVLGLPAGHREPLRAAQLASSAAAPGSGATAAWRSTCWCPPPATWSRSTSSTRVTAAPLSDAALTPYHAIKRCSQPSCGRASTVAVIGVGGLGHMAIQLLRALQHGPVVAVDDAGRCARAGSQRRSRCNRLGDWADTRAAAVRDRRPRRLGRARLRRFRRDSRPGRGRRVDWRGHLLRRAGRRLTRSESRSAAVRVLRDAAQLGHPSRADRGGRRSHGPGRSTSRSNGDPRAGDRHLPAAEARGGPGPRRRGARR